MSEEEVTMTNGERLLFSCCGAGLAIAIGVISFGSVSGGHPPDPIWAPVFIIVGGASGWAAGPRVSKWLNKSS